MYNFFSSSRKESHKNWKERKWNDKKPYLTDYNLLIVQGLWQARYQIWSITLLKEFIN